MIVCEALKVANMSKSAKGDNDNHGKMVKQKAGLNKSILVVLTNSIQERAAQKSPPVRAVNSHLERVNSIGSPLFVILKLSFFNPFTAKVDFL